MEKTEREGGMEGSIMIYRHEEVGMERL